MVTIIQVTAILSVIAIRALLRIATNSNSIRCSTSMTNHNSKNLIDTNNGAARGNVSKHAIHTRAYDGFRTVCSMSWAPGDCFDAASASDDRSEYVAGPRGPERFWTWPAASGEFRKTAPAVRSRSRDVLSLPRRRVGPPLFGTRDLLHFVVL